MVPFSIFFYTKRMKFQKLRSIYTEEKDLSVVDILGHSFTQKELQLNQSKHEQIPAQVLLATVTHDKTINSKHYSVKHETVLLSAMDIITIQI